MTQRRTTWQLYQEAAALLPEHCYRVTDDGFRVVLEGHHRLPPRVWGLWAGQLALFFLVFAGLLAFIVAKTGAAGPLWGGFAAVPVVLGLTFAWAVGRTNAMLRKVRARGPLLVFHRQSGLLELPGLGVALCRDDAPHVVVQSSTERVKESGEVTVLLTREVGVAAAHGGPGAVHWFLRTSRWPLLDTSKLAASLAGRLNMEVRSVHRELGLPSNSRAAGLFSRRTRVRRGLVRALGPECGNEEKSLPSAGGDPPRLPKERGPCKPPRPPI